MKSWIMFKPAMVDAILAGRKSQTRRIVPADHQLLSEAEIIERCAYPVGSRPYVRESYWTRKETGEYAYGEISPSGSTWKHVPSIFMPKIHSRLSITVVGVKVQRLTDVTEYEATAEGMIPNWLLGDLSGWSAEDHGYLPLNWQKLSYDDYVFYSARDAFLASWDYLHPEAPTAANPLILAYQFVGDLCR